MDKVNMWVAVVMWGCAILSLGAQWEKEIRKNKTHLISFSSSFFLFTRTNLR
jgi:hypothetical protein